MIYDGTASVFAGVDLVWRPAILSPSQLRYASDDAALWASAENEFIDFSTTAYYQAQSWAGMQRIAFLQQATGPLGMPAAMTTKVVESMAPMVIRPPKDLDELKTQLTQVVIGVVTDALSAVPIVGDIAAGLVNLTVALIGLKKKPPVERKEWFPPQTAYDDGAEQIAVNHAIPVLQSNDWTSLFLPRLGNDLIIEQREAICPAWVMRSPTKSQNGGLIPGSQQVAGPIQAYVVPAKQKGDKYYCQWSTRGGNAVEWRDIGDFYPSLAQLLTYLSTQVQQPTSALWSVRTYAIRTKWKEHFTAVITWAKLWWNGENLNGSGLDKLTTQQRQAIIQALVRPYFVWERNDGEIVRGQFSDWTPGAEDKMLSIVDAFVEPWCDAVVERQEHYLRTTALAYADPTSGAFLENPFMKALFDINAHKLLDSPARKDVDLKDVIDKELRQELFNRTIGQTLVYGLVNNQLRPPTNVDTSEEPPPPDPPKGGAPFDEQRRKRKFAGSVLAEESFTLPKWALPLGLGVTAALLAYRERRNRRVTR